MSKITAINKIIEFRRDLYYRARHPDLASNLFIDEVSVYEAHKNINGTYSPVLPFPTNEMAFNDFIEHIAYFTGNKYLVTGDLLDETGTNDEPLIKNVKILKKL